MRRAPSPQARSVDAPTSTATSEKCARAGLGVLLGSLPVDGAWPAWPALPDPVCAGRSPRPPGPWALPQPVVGRLDLSVRSSGAGVPAAVDPLRALGMGARLVRDPCAATVLGTDSRCRRLPGLPGHRLLVPGSRLVVAAGERMSQGEVCSTFLWPLGGRHAPGGHVRVTTLIAPTDAPPDVLGVVVLSPAGDLHELTPRELEVLGLLVGGLSNVEIASVLVVAPRTAAAHVEHILRKLGTSSRTSAAVHAERHGCYVPAPGFPRTAVPRPRCPA